MDINYFHNIDSEKKAYWLGFIVADGNISKTTNRISITLNSDDEKNWTFRNETLYLRRRYV